MSIMQHFPASRTPRPGQRTVLERLEQEWSNYDVFVLSLPVAWGKSLGAMTIARWLADRGTKSMVVAPNNMLVDQYLRDNPKAVTLKKKGSYQCASQPSKTCSTVKEKDGGYCKGCHYVQALRKIRAVPWGITNYHIYMAHKFRAPALIVDEAHLTLGVIRELAAKKIWQHEYRWPLSIRSLGDLQAWLETCPDYPEFKEEPKLRKLLHEVSNQGAPQVLLERAKERWHGQWKEVIKLVPLDLRDEPSYLWPKVDKLVLMSATIGPQDIKTLGLDKRKVLYLEGPSPIPPERRPVWYTPVGSMGMAAQEDNLPALATFIREKLLSHAGQKGLIHITYGMMQGLWPLLKDLGPRLVWHDRDTKMDRYEKWRAMAPESGAVLMACGMAEGIDLLEDLGRWQIIAKVAWPSLADPAMRWKSEHDEDFYLWETWKTVLQASGRICRGPEDFGETYIVDSSFAMLYRKSERMIPQWFKEALRWERK